MGAQNRTSPILGLKGEMEFQIRNKGRNTPQRKEISTEGTTVTHTDQRHLRGSTDQATQ